MTDKPSAALLGDPQLVSALRCRPRPRAVFLPLPARPPWPGLLCPILNFGSAFKGVPVRDV